MDKYDTLVKKASSSIRDKMLLELGVEEFVTKGSVIFDKEPPREYNPKIHESCEHVPIHIIYDELDGGEIKNINDIKESVKRSKAKGYILGPPICFNVPDSGGDILVANFPTNFYKLRG